MIDHEISEGRMRLEDARKRDGVLPVFFHTNRIHSFGFHKGAKPTTV